MSNASHDKYDFALAIMQGVACLNKIISVGGGAKSSIWTQLKSDFTNQIIEIPEYEEASCYGAAIIGTVSEGFFRHLKMPSIIV
ncbi:FGGY-family carbohydrate kinase [Photorhabdus asymbiotica]|uniref:FGGY-family carbohydrate kinase n=1 Tax=Photorhabdus asymbiotica TaxID=291112 RepID=UPI003DA74634